MIHTSNVNLPHIYLKIYDVEDPSIVALEYDLYFHHKVTLITGPSGVGKTYLCSLLDPNIDDTRMDVMVTHPVKVVVSEDSITAILGEKHPHIVIIDEVLKISKDKIIALCESKHYVVLIRRSDPVIREQLGNYYFTNGIPLSQTAIMVMHRIGVRHVLSPFIVHSTYNGVPDLFISEDSTKGYTFYQKAFPHIDFATSYGKSRLVIAAYLALQKYDKIMLIYDNSGIGVDILDFEYLLQKFPGRVRLLPVHCLECILANCNMLISRTLPAQQSLLQDTSVYNIEDAYRDLLQKACNTTQAHRYSKKPQNPAVQCFQEDCCPHPYWYPTCDWKDKCMGKDKMELMLNTPPNKELYQLHLLCKQRNHVAKEVTLIPKPQP